MNSDPGATHSATAHGSASPKTVPPALSTFTSTNAFPAGFERNVDVKRLSDIRARTVDITIRIAEAASVAGPAYTHMGGTGYALATVMPRMYAPRSTPPEPDLLHAARRAAERDDTLSKEMLTRRLAALNTGGTAPTEPE